MTRERPQPGGLRVRTHEWEMKSGCGHGDTPKRGSLPFAPPSALRRELNLAWHVSATFACQARVVTQSLRSLTPARAIA